MKRLSKHRSVKLTQTLGGQREILREHTNKINEIIDYLGSLGLGVLDEKVEQEPTCKCCCHWGSHFHVGSWCSGCIHCQPKTASPVREDRECAQEDCKENRTSDTPYCQSHMTEFVQEVQDKFIREHSSPNLKLGNSSWEKVKTDIHEELKTLEKACYTDVDSKRLTIDSFLATKIEELQARVQDLEDRGH